MAWRKRLSKKIAIVSLMLFLLSLVAMHAVTCMKLFLDEHLVNNAGSISESSSYFAALAVCGLSVFSGVGTIWSLAMGRDVPLDMKFSKKLLLFLCGLVMTAAMVFSGWFIYGDPLFAGWVLSLFEQQDSPGTF